VKRNRGRSVPATNMKDSAPRVLAASCETAVRRPECDPLMNPRLGIILAGGVTLLLGLAGLLYPERVMGLLGFAVLNPSHAAAALGEVRATYGGLFVVLGVLTLRAALDPPAHRARLVRLALLWFGACAGRGIGVYLDGNPGPFGWLSLVFEAVLATILLLAAQARSPAPVVAPPAPVT
jgi:hypothetical protein